MTGALLLPSVSDRSERIGLEQRGHAPTLKRR
jgi:hypothetical protein